LLLLLRGEVSLREELFIQGGCLIVCCLLVLAWLSDRFPQLGHSWGWGTWVGVFPTQCAVFQPQNRIFWCGARSCVRELEGVAYYLPLQLSLFEPLHDTKSAVLDEVQAEQHAQASTLYCRYEVPKKA
jgi:hypothetical protein